MLVKVFFDVDEERLKKHYKANFPDKEYNFMQALLEELCKVEQSGIKINYVEPIENEKDIYREGFKQNIQLCPSCSSENIIEKFEMHTCRVCNEKILPCAICQFRLTDEGCNKCPFTASLDDVLN